MRRLLPAIVACFLLSGFSLPAHAYWTTDVASGLQRAHHTQHVRHRAVHYARHRASPRLTVVAEISHVAARVLGLSAPCRQAAALGGPCGCFASEHFFGHSVRNLWLADNWLKFPHVTAASGTAAVWPHRHVAAVLAVNHDGTVTVKDSWAVHRVRTAGLVFVDPHGR